MNAAAPALSLGRLDAAGRREREVHEDDVRRRLERPIDRAARVVGLADDLEVVFLAEDVGNPDAKEGVVVDDQDPRSLTDVTAIGAAPTALWSTVAHERFSSAPTGMASWTSVPPSGRECTSKRAPISSARSCMN